MTETATPAAPPEFPKELLKIVPNPNGGYAVAVQRVTDEDAEAAALEDHWIKASDVLPPPPEPVPYPAWKYSPKHGARIVQTAEEFDALGEGWFDTPADFPEEEKDKEPVAS